MIQFVQHVIEANYRRKFLWGGTDNLPEAFFERALADTKFFVKFFYSDTPLAFVNKSNRLNNKPVSFNVF